MLSPLNDQKLIKLIESCCGHQGLIDGIVIAHITVGGRWPKSMAGYLRDPPSRQTQNPFEDIFPSLKW